MKNKLAWIIVFFFLAAPGIWAGDKKPVKPGLKDKCPVCGMFVAKYPEWVAQITFRDDFRVYFDGSKDLFKYYFQVSRFSPGRGQGDIEALWVTDYYAVTLIDALKAFFVLGSDVYGPMGRELIPFEKEEDAREFLKDHKGQRLLRFREVTPVDLKSLD